MEIVIDDGGRADAGFKGSAGDCVARSIAIVTGKPYREIYTDLANHTAQQRPTKRTGRRPRSARNGINTGRKWFKDYMEGLGFRWTPTMQIGQGCKTHLRSGELPATGRHVISVSKHMTALVNGRIHDTHDCTRSGNRCVYGYWTYDPR